MKKPSRALLRNPLDLWALGTVVLTFALCLIPLFISFSALGLGAYWLAVFVLRRITTAAQHNHAHLNIFKSGPVLNFGYDVLLAQTTGLTTPEWELHHNRGHHRDFRNTKLDLFSANDPVTGLPMPRWWYSLRASLLCWPDSARIAIAEGKVENKNLLARFLTHLLIQTGVIAALLWLNPGAALLFFVVQTFVVRCSVAWSSYWHHLDMPMTGTYDSSRTMLHPLHNLISFNSGHHTAHHEKPTLHWSLLPARTQAILHLIPGACIRNQDAPADRKCHNKAHDQASGALPAHRRVS